MIIKTSAFCYNGHILYLLKACLPLNSFFSECSYFWLWYSWNKEISDWTDMGSISITNVNSSGFYLTSIDYSFRRWIRIRIRSSDVLENPVLLRPSQVRVVNLGSHLRTQHGMVLKSSCCRVGPPKLGFQLPSSLVTKLGTSYLKSLSLIGGNH